MKQIFTILVALLATTNLWAQSFQYDGLYYNITSDTTVEVTYQEFYSTSDYSGLTSVTIPETVTYEGTTYSVTSIGWGAFDYCDALTSVTIPNSVTSIGWGTFSGCSALTSVTIPNSVTSIGESAFKDCESLKTVTIPNSVMSIGSSAFSGCSALTSVTIPNSVMSIGEWAFWNCYALTSVIIGNSVMSIGDEAFWNCYALTSVIIGNSVMSIGDEAFYGCSSLTSITIPNSVTSIGGEAFGSCDNLISIVVISGNDTYDSRENCNAIIETATNTLIAGCKNTIIPNSVTSIGSSAFALCTSLTSVTIPNSVTSIGDEAFQWCSALKTVICEAIEVPELLGGDVFYYMPLSEATLYVPAQSLDDYKAAEQWKEFGTILPIEGESEEEIELQDTEMTIVFTNSEDNDSEIYRQTITIKVPTAPTIAGFTFLYWQPVAEPITNEITIQAIYEADTPTSAEVYTNPANPAQKLLRNGQVYILQDGKTYTITGQKL